VWCKHDRVQSRAMPTSKTVQRWMKIERTMEVGGIRMKHTHISRKTPPEGKIKEFSIQTPMSYRGKDRDGGMMGTNRCQSRSRQIQVGGWTR